MQFIRPSFIFPLICLVFSGCLQTAPVAKAPIGLTPENPIAQQSSIALAQEQREKILAQAVSMTEPRLWFAGFGFHSGSEAFRGDVLLTESRLRENYPQTLSFVFDNALQTEKIKTPFAHLGSLNDTVKTIASQVKKGDIVTIMLSTHGYTKLLATQIGGRDYASILDYHLATALAPLKDTPTILIISACYSGSLIPALQNENRIILTAAAEKKVSYGCQPLAKNTFFVDALYGIKHDGKLSLVAEFELTKKRIAAREIEMKLHPSEPQIFIGEKMKALAAKPQNAWFVADKIINASTAARTE
ncbi:C13 family peptidase [Undibacterium sp. Di24W]|uniref:C13 family peptidase n=1 Tax=Undibacterium sp. Di24W TaxID=3413033 RepID=UPI003BEF677E